VKFTLKASDLAFWNLDMKKIVEPGEFMVWVSKDSASGSPVKFNVK
jgi:beta-glucosidase